MRDGVKTHGAKPTHGCINSVPRASRRFLRAAKMPVTKSFLLWLWLRGWHTRSLAYTTRAAAALWLSAAREAEGIFHDMSRKLWQFLEKRRAPGMEMRARFSLSMDFLPFKYYAAAAVALSAAHNILIGGPHLRGTRARSRKCTRGAEPGPFNYAARAEREREREPPRGNIIGVLPAAKHFRNDAAAIKVNWSENGTFYLNESHASSCLMRIQTSVCSLCSLRMKGKHTTARSVCQ
jgi:hypothetical protein